MADPYQQVFPGQPLHISARSMNGVLRAGQDFSRRKFGDLRAGNGFQGSRSVMLHNTSGAGLPEFSVVGIGPPTILPSVSPFETSANMTFDWAPVLASQPFGVTTEPIGAGSCGEMIISGPALVKVSINLETPAPRQRCAIPSDGASSGLSASPFGVPILWIEDGYGPRWAIVNLQGAYPRPRAYGTFDEAPATGAGELSLDDTILLAYGATPFLWPGDYAYESSVTLDGIADYQIIDYGLWYSIDGETFYTSRVWTTQTGASARGYFINVRSLIRATEPISVGPFVKRVPGLVVDENSFSFSAIEVSFAYPIL